MYSFLSNSHVTCLPSWPDADVSRGNHDQRQGAHQIQTRWVPSGWSGGSRCSTFLTFSHELVRLFFGEWEKRAQLFCDSSWFQSFPSWLFSLCVSRRHQAPSSPDSRSNRFCCVTPTSWWVAAASAAFYHADSMLAAFRCFLWEFGSVTVDFGEGMSFIKVAESENPQLLNSSVELIWGCKLTTKRLYVTFYRISLCTDSQKALTKLWPLPFLYVHTLY